MQSALIPCKTSRCDRVHRAKQLLLVKGRLHPPPKKGMYRTVVDPYWPHLPLAVAGEKCKQTERGLLVSTTNSTIRTTHAFGARQNQQVLARYYTIQC